MAEQLTQLRTTADIFADTCDNEAIGRDMPVDTTTNPSLLLNAAKWPDRANLVADTAWRAGRLKDLPDRLAQLHAGAGSGPLERVVGPDAGEDYVDRDYKDESDFRFQLNANAMATEKFGELIRDFGADQVKLEVFFEEHRIGRVA